jgi:hypothetical protein
MKILSSITKIFLGLFVFFIGIFVLMKNFKKDKKISLPEQSHAVSPIVPTTSSLEKSSLVTKEEISDSTLEAKIEDKNKNKKEEEEEDLEIELIEKADADPLKQVLLKYFKSDDDSNLLINQQLDDYAQGEFNREWGLASRVGLKWQVVATGYSYVDCVDIAGYNFPAEMVPDCWDYGKNVMISR